MLIAALIGAGLGIGPAFAAAGDITTVAGNGEYPFDGPAGDGTPALSAPLASPYGVVAGAGKVFVSESGRDNGNRVIAVDGSQTIATVAGGSAPPLNDGHPATDATLRVPSDVAVDGTGNLFIADSVSNRVRKVAASTGTITTVAGNGGSGSGGDGGPATAAQVNSPSSVELDTAGNLYIAQLGNEDDTNSRVRKVDPSGKITTVAGGGAPADGLGDGGPATGAKLSYPRSVAVSPSGNLYIADLNDNRIRKVAPSGTITTVAGTGAGGLSGDGGPAVAAELLFPSGVAVDGTGAVLIADEGNHRVRRISAAGIISTVAGTGTGNLEGGGFSGDGGPAVSAQLNFPVRVDVDGAGNLLIADSGNNRVRKVSPSGTITTVAGDGSFAFGGDGGPATAAGLNPDGLAHDTSGNLFVADAANDRVRKVDTAGIITTVAGGGIGDGLPASQASLDSPQGLARSLTGELLIADCGHNRVRKVNGSGTISTVAGSAAPKGLGDGGAATSASLGCPTGLAVSQSGPAAGTLYIADSAAHRVRKVAPSGVITTVAGTGTPGFSGDFRPAATSQLSSPSGVALDAAGNLFIADTGNHRVRKVDTSGRITTVAGNGAAGVGSDGKPATSVPVTSPEGVVVNPAGSLLIAETGFARIRKVDAAGTITTIAGNGLADFSGDGGPATAATMDQPTHLAFDGTGNLFFTDRGNLRVRRIEAGAPAPPPVAPRNTAECGKVITTSVTLKTDIGPCPGDGIVVGTDGLTVNLNGHRLFGDGGRTGTDVGVRLTGRQRVKVTGGTVSDFDAGVAIIGGSANTVSNLTVTHNLGNGVFGDGIVAFFSPRNFVLDNVVNDNGVFDGIGILGAGSDSNTIRGNTVTATSNQGDEFGPVGLGIILNPFLGDDRPRGLSLVGNQVIANRVQGNDNAGISSLSNTQSVIARNVVEHNGFGGEAPFPGNGIGVQHLALADPATRVSVQENEVHGNATNGIQILAQSNRILSNNAAGNGGELAGVANFDLADFNLDPVSSEPSCDSNLWSGNIWGTGGFFPDCTTAGGHAVVVASAQASRAAAADLPGIRPGDPPARKLHPPVPR